MSPLSYFGFIFSLSEEERHWVGYTYMPIPFSILYPFLNRARQVWKSNTLCMVLYVVNTLVERCDNHETEMKANGSPKCLKDIKNKIQKGRFQSTKKNDFSHQISWLYYVSCTKQLNLYDYTFFCDNNGIICIICIWLNIIEPCYLSIHYTHSYIFIQSSLFQLLAFSN